MLDHHRCHKKDGAVAASWAIRDYPGPLCCSPLKRPREWGPREAGTGEKEKTSPDLGCGGLLKSAIWGPIRGLRGGYPGPRDGALGASLGRG